MILTVTLNPSVDISYQLNDFKLDKVNRVNKVSKTAGGKGLNVARVLRQLDENVAATGFLGGLLGDFIRKDISSIGIKDNFIQIAGQTRNCIAILHDEQQTEILEGGPVISETEAIQFLEEYKIMIQNVNFVTVSGSLPQGLTSDFYKQLLQIANLEQTKVLLDVNGQLLKDILMSENKPYLIKPNIDELTDFIGKPLNDETQQINALQSKAFKDIPWVILTLGANGALVKHFESFYKVQIPSVDAINPVGSGDSVIAGFAAGLMKDLKDEQLISYGIVMGVLNAIEEKTGYINPEFIDTYIERVIVEKIEL